MKTNQFKVLAIALAIASPFAASASDGTITVTGTVASTTCTINGGAKDIAVPLPKISTTALSAAAAIAAPTTFTVNLSACSSGVTGVYTYFEPGVNVDANGRLINKAASPAENVLVELFNPVTAVKIDINKAYDSQGHSQIAVTGAAGAGTGKGTYGARYYATAAAKAGAFSSTLTYSLVYN